MLIAHFTQVNTECKCYLSIIVAQASGETFSLAKYNSSACLFFSVGGDIF